MTLQPGQTLSHYRIVEKIGEGGMGVVWKALDTSLDREVAIKVLSDVFTVDPKRLARFEREAKLLASLNHPHIAGVFGLHTDGDIRFISMELIAGDDLAERLTRGPMGIRKAMWAAVQVAEALEAAHESGVIHRDLKPANIKFSSPRSGLSSIASAAGEVIKVLDFGLAKALDPSLADSSTTRSPTITIGATQEGVILGTAAYMSPEQARGQMADRRSDIWSFGVVLFEMLTATRAFGGDTVSDTLAAVLRADPGLDQLPAETPQAIRRLLRRCLEKDPRRRLQSIGEARIVLEDLLAGQGDEPEAVAGPASRRVWGWPLLAGIILGSLLAGAGLWSLRPPPPESPVRKSRLLLPAELAGGPQPAVSPDGAKVAYRLGASLWVRHLDQWQSRELPGTAEASSPFWSPDSQSIGYFQGGRLWKIVIDGGQGTVVCDLAVESPDAAWRDDGTIVFTSRRGPLYVVSERGGDPRPLVELAGETELDFHHASVLPDGRGLLLTVHRSAGSADTIDVWRDGQRKTLLQVENMSLAHPVYDRSGYLVYSRAGSNDGIWAAPFSLAALELTGEPFLVSKDGWFDSVSRDGTLVHTSGATRLREMVWVDRDGDVTGTIGKPQRRMLIPALSPDETRVAVGAETSNNRDIWIHDVDRGTTTRLTFDESRQARPSWLPSGNEIAYLSVDGGDETLHVRRADGGAESRVLTKGAMASFTPDGRLAIFHRRGENADRGLFTLSMEDGAEEAVFLDNDADENDAALSPDGRLVAYESDESGKQQIYIKRFPDGDGKWQVSINRGYFPRWNGKGTELFFIGEDGAMMSVPVETGPSPRLGTPEKLFNWSPAWMPRVMGYDVTADGQRFVFIRVAGAEDHDTDIRIVQNWTAEFKDR